jgi:hypothetical protein
MEMTDEWKQKTEQFVDIAFEKDQRPKGTWCPCSKCRNQKDKAKRL